MTQRMKQNITGKEWLEMRNEIRKRIGREQFAVAETKRQEVSMHLLEVLHQQNVLKQNDFRDMCFDYYKPILSDVTKGVLKNIVMRNNSEYAFMDEKGELRENIAPCWIPTRQEERLQVILPYGDYKRISSGSLSCNVSYDKKEDAKYALTFKQVVTHAFSLGASDIHVTYSVGWYSIFFRIDGVLVYMNQYTMKEIAGQEFVKAVKIEASEHTRGEFNSDQHNMAQDARLEYESIGTHGVDCRLAFIPSGDLKNQALVARLLERKTIETPNFKAMGYSDSFITILKQVTKQRGGLCAISGVTGSGKSTLQANLLIGVEESKRIFTLEDPIELLLAAKNITQHQIYIPPKEDKDAQAKKMGYLEYVMSLKRADPDIVSVGEMRNDRALTKAVTEMSEAGQLVFTTLHITSAFSIYETLQEIFEVNRKISTPLILFSVNQVLVRRLCKHCRVVDPKGEKNVERLREIKDNLKYAYKYPIEELIDDSVRPDLFLRNENGCEECGGTGYAGRVPIYEYFYPDVEAREWMAKEEPTRYAIEKYACGQRGIGKNKLQVMVELLLEGEIDTSEDVINKIA